MLATLSYTCAKRRKRSRAKVRRHPWNTVREAAKWYEVLPARSMWLGIGVLTDRKDRERRRIKRQRWSGGEENERQMENNVMRGIRVCDGYLVCLDLCVDIPGNGARNPSCYLLSMRWFSLEEERVMQESSVSISLSFWELRYQSRRRLHASRLVPEQTNKNIATEAIKGLSIPSRSLTKVRSDKDNKINIMGIFVV